MLHTYYKKITNPSPPTENQILDLAIIKWSLYSSPNHSMDCHGFSSHIKNTGWKDGNQVKPASFYKAKVFCLIKAKLICPTTCTAFILLYSEVFLWSINYMTRVCISEVIKRNYLTLMRQELWNDHCKAFPLSSDSHYSFVLQFIRFLYLKQSCVCWSTA